MKKVILLVAMASIFYFAVTYSRNSDPISSYKDLGWNMMDLRIYQENLGEHIRAGKLKDADWLLEGMDSILLLLGDQFREHRKLSSPFSYHYKKEMRTPIRMIRESIREYDTTLARKGYKLLVKNCNSCHLDHEVDKKVWE